MRGRARALVVLLCSIVQACSWEAPTIKAPSSDYIIIESRSGFGNRVRVLAAYLYLKSRVLDVDRIVMVWDLNEECIGHFLDVMVPIETVSFVSSSQAAELETNSRFRAPSSFSTFRFILKNFGVALSERYVGYLYALTIGKYIRPLPCIWANVSAFVKKHTVCNSLSIHDRGTDFVRFAERNNVSLHDCNARIRKSENISSVFLMTDSLRTRSSYLEVYGQDKILTFGTFKSNVNGIRETTLEHTITEVLIAAHGSHFCGTYPASSLHSLVVAYRQIFRHQNLSPIDTLFGGLNFLQAACRVDPKRKDNDEIKLWRQAESDILQTRIE